jgi:hypothetical protein
MANSKKLLFGLSGLENLKTVIGLSRLENLKLLLACLAWKM